jgi:CubicO group peptidase (beta-lactamase class C family)
VGNQGVTRPLVEIMPREERAQTGRGGTMHGSQMMMRAGLAMLLLGGVSMATAAGDHPMPTVTAKVRAQIEAGQVAGVVTYVANPGRVLHLEAAGQADREAGTPLRPDSIFWIASMTKPITGTAVLMLHEEGKLSVDDRVDKYLHALGHLKTADGAEHPITIRQLLTHTSGMGEISTDEARECRTLADVIPRYAAKPLQFVPGSKWSYCQSSINTAARIVEVVSGQSFPEFLEKRLFQPLGMKDTTFYLSADQLKRLSKSYARTEDGQLAEAPNRILYGKSPTDRDRFPAANGGLFSTASDYGLFARMILNDGTLNGKQYLKPSSVALMTSVQTGELTTGFTSGNGWGLGWCVVRRPQGVTAALSPGSCGHGGAYGTQAWLDPVRKLVYVLMVQRSNFPNSDASDLRREFQNAVAADLQLK